MPRDPSLVDDLFPEIGATREIGTAADQWIDRQRAEARARSDEELSRGPSLWNWLETIHRSRAAGDPWYVTGSKAIIGPEDYNKVYQGNYWPVAQNLAPFILMGGRGPKMRPRVPALTRAEMELPPETKKLWDFVQGYQPETYNRIPPEAQSDIFNWRDLPFAEPPYPRGRPHTPNEIRDRADQYASSHPSDNIFENVPPPPTPPRPRWMHDMAEWLKYPNDFEGIPKNASNLGPFAPRPEPPLKITGEDLPFGQQDIHISKQEVDAINNPEIPPEWGQMMKEYLSENPPNQWVPPPETPLPGEGYADPNDIQNFWGYPKYYDKPAYVPRDYIEFLRFKAAPASDAQPSYPAGTPPPYFPKPPGNVEQMQTGGVAGSSSLGIDDPYAMPGPTLDDENIPILPNYTYIPSGDFGAYDLPPSPDFPPVEEEPQEFIDSADYIGGANYYYSATPAPSPTPPPQVVNNNYYGAYDQLRRDQEERRIASERVASAFGSSLPPATGSSVKEQTAMMEQMAAIAEAHRRFDAEERRKRMAEQKEEEERRFGPPPPSDYESLRLLQNPVNREYMKDFFDYEPRPSL